MLPDPFIPFPQVGSYGLHEVAGQMLLARIIAKNPADQSVSISLPSRFGSSGNRTVPLAQVADGTPLTAAENDEVEALSRELRAIKRIRTDAQREKKARHDDLRLRRIHANTLQDLMRRAGLLRANGTEAPKRRAAA